MATSLSESIKFLIHFKLNTSPKSMDWTDMIDWNTFVLPKATAKIICKIIDPLNSVIYVNAGWETNDFTNEDIEPIVSLTKASIASITCDSNGVPVPGVYTFLSKVIDTNDPTTVLYNSKTYNFQYVSPVVKIDVSASNRTSELTSEDVTDYAVDSINPTTITLSHTITQPSGGGMSPVPGTTSDSSRTIGGGSTIATYIWTGFYLSTIVSTLFYELEEWATGEAYWFTVADQVTGTKDYEVENDRFLEDYYSLLQTLNTKSLEAAARGGIKEVEAIRRTVLDVNLSWVGYNWARENGVDTTLWATQIKDYLTSETGLTPYENTTSVPVVPWGVGTGGGGTVVAPIFIFGVGVPSGGTGNNGDIYIISSGVGEGNVYFKIAGSWVYQMNIKGTAGTTTLYPAILENNVTEVLSEANTNEKTFKSKELATDILTRVGDVLIISTVFDVVTPPNELTNFYFKIKAGSTVLLTCRFSQFSAQTNVELIVKLTLTAINTFFVEPIYEVMTEPLKRYRLTPSSFVNMLGTLTLSATAQKQTAAGIAGDIVNRVFRIEKLDKS